MRKQFLILETTQFQYEDELRPAPRPRQQAVQERPGQLPARPRLADGDQRFIPMDHADVVICYSIHDAEEYVEEALRRNPHHKFVIFESVAFLESAPSPTIKKRWDANGQLTEF